jgi:hypothetical protein
MRVTMLLADSAQEVNGKLYILGGGWSVTGPMPTPHAVVLKFDVPWDRANRKHKIVLELLTADGEPVILNDQSEEQAPLRVEGELEVGRPVGLKAGTPIDASMAINFGPIPLEPDRRYQWRLSIDGHHEEDWVLGFTTRPLGPSQQLLG